MRALDTLSVTTHVRTGHRRSARRVHAAAHTKIRWTTRTVAGILSDIWSRRGSTKEETPHRSRTRVRPRPHGRPFESRAHPRRDGRGDRRPARGRSPAGRSYRRFARYADRWYRAGASCHDCDAQYATLRGTRCPGRRSVAVMSRPATRPSKQNQVATGRSAPTNLGTIWEQ
jgi:hypothetical protein